MKTITITFTDLQARAVRAALRIADRGPADPAYLVAAGGPGGHR